MWYPNSHSTAANDYSYSQGYDADHPDIDLLRLRNYTIGRKLSQDEVVGEGGLDRVAELLTCLQPFVSSPSRTLSPALVGP